MNAELLMRSTRGPPMGGRTHMRNRETERETERVEGAMDLSLWMEMRAGEGEVEREREGGGRHG